MHVLRIPVVRHPPSLHIDDFFLSRSTPLSSPLYIPPLARPYTAHLVFTHRHALTGCVVPLHHTVHRHRDTPPHPSRLLFYYAPQPLLYLHTITVSAILHIYAVVGRKGELRVHSRNEMSF